MTCAIHVATQAWCSRCATPVLANGTARHDADAVRREAAADAPDFTVVVGNPLLRETVVDGAALDRVFAATRLELRDARVTIAAITDAAGVTGPHQGIDDRDAPAAVRDTIAALRDEIATLRSAEAVQIAAAQLAATRSSLREVIAIVTRTGGFMSPEDQQTLRDARAVIA